MSGLEIAVAAVGLFNGLRQVLVWFKNTATNIREAGLLNEHCGVVAAHFDVVNKVVNNINSRLVTLDKEVLKSEEALSTIEPFVKLSLGFTNEFKDLPKDLKTWEAASSATGFLLQYQKDLDRVTKRLIKWQHIMRDCSELIDKLSKHAINGEDETWAFPLWTSWKYGQDTEITSSVLAEAMASEMKILSLDVRFFKMVDLLVHKNMAGKISFIGFKDFMMRFGPISDCLAKGEALIEGGKLVSWYHPGPRDDAEAAVLKMDHTSPTSFLIRPSDEVDHILIVNTSSGYRMLFQDDERHRVNLDAAYDEKGDASVYYKTLRDLVNSAPFAEELKQSRQNFASQQTKPITADKPEWKCRVCTFLNDFGTETTTIGPTRRKCTMCGHSQLVAPPLPASTGVTAAAGSTAPTQAPAPAPAAVQAPGSHGGTKRPKYRPAAAVKPVSPTDEKKQQDDAKAQQELKAKAAEIAKTGILPASLDTVALTAAGKELLKQGQVFEKCYAGSRGFHFQSLCFKLSADKKEIDYEKGSIPLLGCECEILKEFDDRGVKYRAVRLTPKGGNDVVIRGPSKLVLQWAFAVQELVADAGKAPGAQQAAPTISSLRWKCGWCSLLNFPTGDKRREKCESCGASVKDAQEVKSQAKPAEPKPESKENKLLPARDREHRWPVAPARPLMHSDGGKVKVVWQFDDSEDPSTQQWRACAEDMQALLETAFKSQQEKTQIKWKQWTLEFNLKGMSQRNTTTGKIRALRREHVSDSEVKAAAPAPAKAPSPTHTEEQWFKRDGGALLNAIREQIKTCFARHGEPKLTENPDATLSFGPYKLSFPANFPHSPAWIIGGSGRVICVTDIGDPDKPLDLQVFSVKVMSALGRVRAINKKASLMQLEGAREGEVAPAG